MKKHVTELVMISVKLPRRELELLDSLVRVGMYTSRSDAVRTAIKLLIRNDNMLQKLLDRLKSLEGRMAGVSDGELVVREEQ